MILDISIGLLVAVGVGFLTDGTSIVLVVFGGFSAVVADVDFFIYLLRNNWKVDQFAHEHRDLFHNPIIFSLGGGIILLSVFGPSWALVWVLGTIYHFVHDTLESGWGVRWLYPFDKRYFTLASYSPQRIIRDKAEQRQIAAKHGNPDWLKEESKIRPRLVYETTLLVVSIAISVLWLT
ncbi:metal-dependent hydrolase [Patescibacteria group bacterium]|nr:metal-dependent hydrolase [Patescibacteria group bacterium]